MKYHYTRKVKVRDGFKARNPHFFDGAYRDAKEVVIDGDYPEIVDAYAKLGVKAEIEGVKAPAQNAKPAAEK